MPESKSEVARQVYDEKKNIMVITVMMTRKYVRVNEMHI